MDERARLYRHLLQTRWRGQWEKAEKLRQLQLMNIKSFSPSNSFTFDWLIVAHFSILAAIRRTNPPEMCLIWNWKVPMLFFMAIYQRDWTGNKNCLILTHQSAAFQPSSTSCQPNGPNIIRGFIGSSFNSSIWSMMMKIRTTWGVL